MSFGEPNINRRIGLGVCLAGLVGVGDLHAFDPMLQRNRFSLSGTFNFLFSAEFDSSTPVNNIGAIASSGATGTAENRNYDDGFVNIDVSGNAGGTTWNWGYQDASQLAGIGTAGATLMFHSAPSPTDGVTRESDDEVLPGLDFGYSRLIGSWQNERGRWGSWGLQANFGYTDLSLRDSGTTTGMVPLTTDTYLIGAAALPPAPPFSGTLAGPGTLIPDNPMGGRVTALAASTSTVRNELAGEVYAVSAGAFFEIPLHERIIAKFSGQLAGAAVNRSYRFTETRATVGAPAVNTAGEVSGTDLLMGAGVGLDLLFPVTGQFDFIAGVKYQYFGRTSIGTAGKSASLNLDSTVSARVGVGWRF